jgi:hypothetical protein
MLGQLIGKEFVFVLSQRDNAELRQVGDSVTWRVDQCTAAVGDLEREVRGLISLSGIMAF